MITTVHVMYATPFLSIHDMLLFVTLTKKIETEYTLHMCTSYGVHYIIEW